MTAHIQHFVPYIPAALSTESEDLMFKALPLRRSVIRVVFLICIVGATDKTEVHGCLQASVRLRRVYEKTEEQYIVETGRLSVWVILQEVS
jgi:hypothetical protein